MIKTKREMLELAAKATGLINYEYYVIGMRELVFQNLSNCGFRGPTWNPLTDSRDCARMEANLEIDIRWRDGYVMSAYSKDSKIFHSEYYNANDDGSRDCARRYASTMVAAMIGRGMK